MKETRHKKEDNLELWKNTNNGIFPSTIKNLTNKGHKDFVIQNVGTHLHF